jgi:hypothetical protein
LDARARPTPVGSFNITELGGSGSNGVNTVYFLDTTGKAGPNGTGLPAPGAQLLTTGLYPGSR